MEKEKKLTKKDFYGMIIEACANNQEIVAFCNHEIELLTRKASKSGQTKVQKENEDIIAKITTFLADNSTRVFTATEIGETFAISNQKASALLKKMVEAGMADRVEEKRKAYFKIAE